MTDPTYTTPADLRPQSPEFRDATADQLAELISEFEEIAEGYLGQAQVLRTVVDEEHMMEWGALELTTTNAWWPAFVTLDHPAVQSVTSVSIDGTTIDPAMYQIDSRRLHVMFAPWIVDNLLGPKIGLVKVSYTHGKPSGPDARLVRATRVYVRAALLEDISGVPGDVITQGMGEGGYTRFSSADPTSGRPTGLRVVDRLLNSLATGPRTGAVA